MYRPSVDILITYGHLSIVGGGGMSSSLPRSFSANKVGIQSPMNHNLRLNATAKRSMNPSQMSSKFQPCTGMINPSTSNIDPATPTKSSRRFFDDLLIGSFPGRRFTMVTVLLSGQFKLLKHIVHKRLPWRATPDRTNNTTNEHYRHENEYEHKRGNVYMEQHLAEKEDYKWEDGNSEKNIEDWSSSVIDFEDGFHGTAILKLHRCFVSVCLRKTFP